VATPSDGTAGPQGARGARATQVASRSIVRTKWIDLPVGLRARAVKADCTRLGCRLRCLDAKTRDCLAAERLSTQVFSNTGERLISDVPHIACANNR
jgi:hypothetical protein